MRDVQVPASPLAVVCEDEPALAVALRTVLAAHGLHVVATVGRGADLVAVVREHDPAVVVVDVALLGAQGVGRLAAVRAASAACLVAVCPPGLDLPTLMEYADLVVAGDDLRPLAAALPALLQAAGPAQAASAAEIGSVSSNAWPV